MKYYTLFLTHQKKWISPLDENINIMLTTSLGWTKCYAPTVASLPESANYPFHDFVAMAALLQVNRITALKPGLDLPCIEYLRRSDSICGKRTAENFTLHIPEQLKRFLAAVVELPDSDAHRAKKVELAMTFVAKKLDQYENTLKGIIKTNKSSAIEKPYPGIDESTLDSYLKEAKSIRESMQEKSQERRSYSPLQLH